MLCVKIHGEIDVGISHHVCKAHDGCIFVAIRLFGKKAARVHKAHDTEQLNLFYLMIGLAHHE